MALSSGDPHSYAKPGSARVVNIHLELNVDFDRKVLKGKATLTVEKELWSNKVILDSYKLDVSRVADFYTGSELKGEIGHCGTFGSKFTIPLQNVIWNNNRCKIEIEYETSPKSPALYWLTQEQTADGIHTFLLSNNKYTYARAVFPCQDTPSVKFTYSAKIVAPPGFKVLMSASLKRTPNSSECVYEFFQHKPIPSYAVVIAVGVLNYVQLGSRISVWAENKYLHTYSLSTKLCPLSLSTEKMLQIAENLYGVYPWDSLDICVLPPSISHFEIECPCLVFVSPTLLGGDISLISTPIARSISQHWTGLLVTCANYKHLWLNKSFSMYICRRILLVLLPEDIRRFTFARDLDDVRATSKDFADFGLLESLLPTNLIGMLPDEVARYVPYEKGYLFLIDLQNLLDEALVFETFLKSYLTKFADKSITTYDWKSYLYNYFPKKVEIFESMNWSILFDEQNTLPPQMIETTQLTLAEACISLAEKWINWDENTDIPFIINDIAGFCDLQKIYFLNYLHGSRTILSEKKMRFMAGTYHFDDQNDEIRFVWLRLCIKSRWVEKVTVAINFAIKFCSPKFTYPIFEDLYEWSNVQTLVRIEYNTEGWKMLDEIKKKVACILHLNESVNDIFDIK